MRDDPYRAPRMTAPLVVNTTLLLPFVWLLLVVAALGMVGTADGMAWTLAAIGGGSIAIGMATWIVNRGKKE